MAGKVGTVVVYTPTEAEQPSLKNEQLAAIITRWDEETEKADLSIFAPNAAFVIVKSGAVEGTVAGTFQQFGSEPLKAKAAPQPPPAAMATAHKGK